MGIMFSISRKAITYLIHSSGTLHPSLKIRNYRVKLEYGMSESMRSSNLIRSDLSKSGSSTLFIFFTLENKGIGRGCPFAEKESKQPMIQEIYSWPLFRLIWLNRSVITLFYVERKIAIHGYYLSLTISRIGSFIPILSMMDCTMIQIICNWNQSNIDQNRHLLFW
jgi:hypothetical protein